MKLRVCDYIARYIENTLGVDTVFMVSGGGMMFLSDGLALSNIKVVCNHHEQASAMGAAAYAKYTGKYGVAYLTTGCGGTNAITGLLNAYQDNTPCLFISGQVKRKETSRNSQASLRQFGVQEADIIAVVEPLTKYAKMVNEPKKISYYLEKAAYIAQSGRPGPVWLDIPMDVQASVICGEELSHFIPERTGKVGCTDNLKQSAQVIGAKISRAQRPVIVAGQGVRLGRAIEGFREFIEKNRIPYVASRLGIDLLPSSHELFIGRIGNKGDRAGNFAVQNADLMLVLGSRLSVSSTGHEYSDFAREAEVIVVDVCAEEHMKNTVAIDMFVEADVKEMLELLVVSNASAHSVWAEKCLEWKQRWPVMCEEYRYSKNGINLYHFVDELSRYAPEDSVFISDAGSAFYVMSQGVQLRGEQRYVTSGGQAEMGFSLPAAIGVAASGNKNVLAVTGDGSLQMNIQEIQTLLYNQFPVKLFVWNNDGYLSIRASQRKFCEGRYIGTDSTSGVSFPDLEKISAAYGVRFVRIANQDELGDKISEVISLAEPVICEVMCIRDQEIVPAVSAMKKDDGTMISKPLEDMYPYLSREEFYKEMIVKPIS